MSETQTRRRVSMTQLLHLWEFLNKHKEIAVGYNKSTQAREHSRRMWEKAAGILNSAGEGATKTGTEWSKYWVDMKSKLKSKNRLINDSRRRTGGGSVTKLELSELDRKFLSILGGDYGTGLPGIRVEPFDLQPPVLHENEDNVAGPSNMDTSQSTESGEPIYLLVPSSEEHQQSEPNEVVAYAASPQSPLFDLASPLFSPSRQQATGQSARRHFVPPVEAEPSPLTVHGTTGQSAGRHFVPPMEAEPSALTMHGTTGQSAGRHFVPPMEVEPSPLPMHGTIGQSGRRRLVLPVEADSSPLPRQGTPDQVRTRRQRRLGRQMSVADARERLVMSSERRAQAELANSRSLEQVSDSLREIVSILRNIQAGYVQTASLA